MKKYLFYQYLKSWRWTQSTAHSSPLSKFLVTGKNTGNFSKFGIPLQIWCFISGRIQWFAVKFPAQWNREFLDAYQGIYGQQKRKNREFLIEKYIITALGVNVIVENARWYLISRLLDDVRK